MTDLCHMRTKCRTDINRRHVSQPDLDGGDCLGAMGEENLIKQLLPWLYKSDTGRACINVLRVGFSASLHCAAIKTPTNKRLLSQKGKVSNQQSYD